MIEIVGDWFGSILGHKNHLHTESYYRPSQSNTSKVLEYLFGRKGPIGQQASVHLLHIFTVSGGQKYAENDPKTSRNHSKWISTVVFHLNGSSVKPTFCLNLGKLGLWRHPKNISSLKFIKLSFNIIDLII